MKKIVPDPPPSFPIPYITIIADLTPEDAIPHITALLDCLSNTLKLYLDTQAEDQRKTVLENIAILTELIRTLSAHVTALEAAHGR